MALSSSEFPASPTVGQQFTASNKVTYEWRGTKWVIVTGISGGALGANSVNSAAIVDGAVAAPDLADDSVTSAKIADGSVATADLAPAVAASIAAAQADATAALAAVGISSDADNILTLGLDGKPKLDRNVDGGGAVFV